MTNANRGQVALLLLLLFSLTGLLAGCGVDEKQQDIYDDDAQIAQTGDSYSFSRRVAEADENQLSVEFTRFYGMQTIWTVHGQESGQLLLDFDVQVKGGKFKVVIVTPDQEVVQVLEQCGQGEKTIETVEGDYSVKIVGKSARGSAWLQLSTDGDWEN